MKTVWQEGDPLPKVTDRQLLLIGAMVDQGAIYTGNSPGSRGGDRLLGFFIGMVDGRRLGRGEFVPFGLTPKDFDDLWKKGLLTRLDKQKTADRILAARGEAPLAPEEHRRTGTRSPFSWYDNPERASDLAVAVVRASRDRLEALRGRWAEARDNPRLLVSRHIHEEFTGFNTRKQRTNLAGQLYVVLEETPKGFRVAPFEKGTRHDPATKGTGNNVTISREDVLAVDVTTSQYDAMRRASAGFLERQRTIREEAEAEIRALSAPIRERAEARIRQLSAMLEDEMREAMEPPGDGPKP